jgi:hypothetical protein
MVNFPAVRDQKYQINDSDLPMLATNPRPLLRQRVSIASVA